jgi:hypothetical protein
MVRAVVSRGTFLVSMALATLSPASAEEWVSRHGGCYEWEGRWDVRQEPSGVWVGIIDFVHVGGPCSKRTEQFLTHELRAAIAGSDFFGRRTTGSTVCHMHGTIRGIEVRGYEVCSGATAPLAFALRLGPPEAR